MNIIINNCRGNPKKLPNLFYKLNKKIYFDLLIQSLNNHKLTDWCFLGNLF